MPNILPANRVAAIATWLTALGALIAAVEGTLPAPWMNTALALGALVTKLAVALHFMSGSQKFDQIQARTPAVQFGGGLISSGGTGNAMGTVTYTSGPPFNPPESATTPDPEPPADPPAA